MRKILFLLQYYAYTILFFVVAKAIFLLYLHAQADALDVRTIGQLFWYGLRLDASFAAYWCMLPFLLIAITDYTGQFYPKFLKIYTGIVLFVMTLIVVADLEIYREWGSHLNATPLLYLASPREALAASGNAPMLLLVSIFVVFFGAFYWLFSRWLVWSWSKIKPSSWKFAPVFLLLTAVLIIPMRGGLQLIPINQSASYFSANRFANQAAVNAAWNLMHALTHRASKQNPYTYFSDNVAAQRVRDLYQNKEKDIDNQWIKAKNPNVLLIVWESATAKVFGSLGGEKGITPQFDSLTKQGILFSNCYASGDRSDKGLVSILSGFPAQPATSIISYPDKTRHLPHLCADLRKEGYQTAFYYGGEPEFANMRSYFFNGGFEKIIGKNDFSAKDCNSKWGAHDHIVLNRMLTDLNQRPNPDKPFFYTLFTLSSHEPFEVPDEKPLSNASEEQLFLNAHRYTDRSIGAFVAQAQKQDWWKNTVVVIIADHGHRLPHESPNHAPEKFTIPMLWLGGALAVQDTVIQTICNQTDLAATILQQLHIQPQKPYTWSQNIATLAPENAFAFYAFNDGAGWIRPDSRRAWDNVGKSLIFQTGTPDTAATANLKAYEQRVFQEFLDK